ncbi:MAG TPA: 1-deoxy-D-xylulose-5-phosphate synthase, partial [Coriobacteriia bacterium]|nr:1-deoxy-D-xylulose-5-phosphate synthase [Coriobacteriia bacterium]
GLAFEGLNNAGASPKTNLLVILNDNNMAIDEATGALKSYLLKISTSVRYNRFKQRLWSVLSAHAPWLLRLLQRTGNAVKQGVLNNSNLFESLDFRYFGPIDGHNLKQLVRTLRALRKIEGPKLLHVLTVKGKGYTPAEHDRQTWHAPGKFDPATGERIKSNGDIARYQEVFGQTMVDLARADSRVVGITPAMSSGCSMDLMMKAFPERCFDVGIAEGHAVTFSAGLAAAGMRPFCNIYSAFMQRAYDNVIHDVAIQDLPVTMCLDRGGLVGEDGTTHHGVFDLAYLRSLPNMKILAPADDLQMRDALHTAIRTTDGPIALRYPRGEAALPIASLYESTSAPQVPSDHRVLPVGKALKLREGSDLAILAVGRMVENAYHAARILADQGIEAAVYNMLWVKPIDVEAVLEAAKTGLIVTVEEGTIVGGFGSAVLEVLAREAEIGGEAAAPGARVVTIGIEDKFVGHGNIQLLLEEQGLSADKLAERIEHVVRQKDQTR